MYRSFGLIKNIDFTVTLYKEHLVDFPKILD